MPRRPQGRPGLYQRPKGRAAHSPPGWAVVTGASSGLGREFALALAERGHPVLAVARRHERLLALAEEAGARGGLVEPLVADLSTPTGIETLVAKASQLEVELLVNNAGAGSYGPFASLSLERERELVRLNVEAIVTLTRGLLPAMIARGRGGVINLASIVAFQPMPYFAAYGASKAFVLSFSEALAEELRGTGVRVTAVAPGVTDTGFADVAGSHHPESRLPHLQSGRVVRAALRAHDRGRTLKVVGAFYVSLTIAGRFTPRAVLRRMMGRLWRPPSSSRSARLRLPRGDRGLGSQQTTRDE
jgi:short-subunit dehydrogenase